MSFRNSVQCWTKSRLEKNNSQCCKKRNLIYETWCISCEEKEKIKEKLKDKKEAKAEMSHLPKHYIEMHQEEKIEEVEFGIRVVQYCLILFEKQILRVYSSKKVHRRKEKETTARRSRRKYERLAQ